MIKTKVAFLECRLLSS